MEHLVSFSVFSCGALQMTCIVSEEQIIPIAWQWPEFFLKNILCNFTMICILSQETQFVLDIYKWHALCLNNRLCYSITNDMHSIFRIDCAIALQWHAFCTGEGWLYLSHIWGACHKVSRLCTSCLKIDPSSIEM